MGMLARYWVRFEDQTVGPHTLKILHDLPGFSRDTLVCPDGDKVWRKAEEVESIRALLDASNEEEVEEMLKSPIEKRRSERKRKAREEKEGLKRQEKEREEAEQQEKIKKMSSGESGFNPMWLFLMIVLGGLGYLGYGEWKKSQEPEIEIPKVEVLPFPDREKHWAWRALGRQPGDIIDAYGKDSAELITPDGTDRFQPGGDLGRWSRYEKVVILIPKPGADYGSADGVAAAASRNGVISGVGRRYEAIDPEDMPRLSDALPKSFAKKPSMRAENDNTWRMNWKSGREDWGALVMQNPSADEGIEDWRVKEYWVTKAE